MTRTVKENTSDLDAHDSAVALLGAAEDLGVDAEEVRTVSAGRRIDFDVPAEVYDAAGLGGGTTITATLTGAYQGSPEAGWLIDAAIAATSPPRPVTLRLPDIRASFDVQADLVGSGGESSGYSTLSADLTVNAHPEVDGQPQTLRITDANGGVHESTVLAGRFYSDIGAITTSGPATVRLISPSDPDTYDETTMTFDPVTDNSTGSVTVVNSIPGGANAPSTFELTTGDTAEEIAQVAGTPVAARLTDVTAAVHTDQSLAMTPGADSGPFTITVEVP